MIGLLFVVSAVVGLVVLGFGEHDLQAWLERRDATRHAED